MANRNVEIMLFTSYLLAILQISSGFIQGIRIDGRCHRKAVVTTCNLHRDNEKELWYEERVSENPSNVENLIKFAHFLQGIGKYDRAAKIYSTALQFDSEEARRQSHILASNKNAPREIQSWKKTETATEFQYDTLSEQWTEFKVLLRWESGKPYAVGGQRECKRLKISDLKALNASESDHVAKSFSMAGSSSNVDVKDYFQEVLQQHVAQRFADEFNWHLERAGIQQTVSFLPVHVLKTRGGGATNVEAFLEGEYTKHNDNYGNILTEDVFPHALSHFSWRITRGRLMLCDIQGVNRVYTDAQIHSNVTSWSFGRGDYGEFGMEKFFASHECNEICRLLKLDQAHTSEDLQAQRSFFSSDEGLQAAFDTIVLRGVETFQRSDPVA
uniref:Alpha-type protein kinase domain-containing protein n=1 Tax=Hanusia phi TaxID=3032 RepID=A0A7S0DZW1_9CRYP|mmetsp:Transcript_12992/g.29871  ORF Transcript_12992/g.29871 Transcript_12992/m.29871 type:complete len:386 (+) Transcript_12992:78-1235(+)